MKRKNEEKWPIQELPPHGQTFVLCCLVLDCKHNLIQSSGVRRNVCELREIEMGSDGVCSGCLKGQ